MQRFDIGLKRYSWTLEQSAGGGVIDAELMSYFACPKCSAPLRFMALFEDENQSRLVGTQAGMMSRMEVAVSGRFLVATISGPHGRGGSYRYNDMCNRSPFHEGPKELVRQIWARFQQGWGKIDWNRIDEMPKPDRGQDVTQLDGIEYVEDQIDSGIKPMLIVRDEYLRTPTDLIVGSWNRREEDRDMWAERFRNGKYEFLRMIDVVRVMDEF